jgi:hypothetical protein
LFQSGRLRECAPDLLDSFSPWTTVRISYVSSVKSMFRVNKPKVGSVTCRTPSDLTLLRKATSRHRERGIPSSKKKRTHLTSPRDCRRQESTTDNSRCRSGMFMNLAYHSQLTYQIAALPTSSRESQAPIRVRTPQREPTSRTTSKTSVHFTSKPCRAAKHRRGRQ